MGVIEKIRREEALGAEAQRPILAATKVGKTEKYELLIYRPNKATHCTTRHCGGSVWGSASFPGYGKGRLGFPLLQNESMHTLSCS